MILEQHTQYQATITLSGLDLLAPNSVITGKLQDVGFINVLVEGSGKQRTATGTWGKPTQEAEVPKQVSSIKKI